MLTRQQIAACLSSLGFKAAAGETSLAYAGIRVYLLDAPRIAAHSAAGDVVYLAVSSAGQLQEQLTGLLGYQRAAAESNR